MILEIQVPWPQKKTGKTLPKTNMQHNHGGLEDHFPFQIGDFLVPC